MALERERPSRRLVTKQLRLPGLESVTTTIKEADFITKARREFVVLLETSLEDLRLVADKAQRMAYFDPEVLLTLPLDNVTACFTSFFTSFQLRGWVDQPSEVDSRDGCLEFVDRLVQLSWLCLTRPSRELPAIKFRDVDSSRPRCRLSSVILPAQPYLVVAPNAFATSTTDIAMLKYEGYISLV